MSDGQLVAKFGVVSKAGDKVWDTEVHHHLDEDYEMFSITQQDEDTGEYITVLLHREQLAALANQAKGH